MKHQSKNRAYTQNMRYEPPNGIFYRRACEYMGIDPDNNPNVKTRQSKQGEGGEIAGGGNNLPLLMGY